MHIFHCDYCQQLIFFENVQCVRCGHLLAYLPDLEVVGSLEPVGEDLWRSLLPQAVGRLYRLCANYTRENVCNWAVPAADPEPLCRSCRLTQVIPDLTQPGHRDAWYNLEVAKRRLLYSLLRLGLPLVNKVEDPVHGLAYEFRSEPEVLETAPVLTGHCNGVITINVAEADDAEREKRRLQMHEPYRTLLGHFRHESGHYYWDRLLQSSNRLETFRDLFGDEREDYSEALTRYYQQRAPADWSQRFVSAYASAHPWEDWAETWAHYLHMTDTLETAAACGLALQPRRPDEPALQSAAQGGSLSSFERLIDDWLPLTYVLNNLNRSLGLPDGYPFVLSPAVLAKVRFVHETVAGV